MPEPSPHEEGCKCAWCEESPSLRELMAQAKIGMDALVDEATGYQEVRPERELRERYVEYWSRG